MRHLAFLALAFLFNPTFAQSTNDFIAKAKTLEGKSDYRGAIYWYSRCAAQGNDGCLTSIFNILDSEKAFSGGEQNALYLFNTVTALEKERPDGYCEAILGWMYENGKGVSVDKSAALKWYLAAGNHNNIWSKQALATMYLQGEGTDVDTIQGLYWEKQAADQGNLDALNDLGHFYSWGIGVPKNVTKAEFYLQKAADQGSALGQYNLACLYDVKRGYEAGDLLGKGNYAIALCEGRGVAQDKALGLQLLKEVVAKYDNHQDPFFADYLKKIE